MTTRFEPHETTSTPAAAWISLKLDQYPTLKIKSPLSREFYWIFESGPAAYELEKQFQSGAEGARALLSRFHELKKQVAQKTAILVSRRNTMTPPTARDLFVQAVLRISAAIDGPGLETAREIFPERLAKVAKLLEILDGKWVDHRDNGGVLPLKEISDWERAWLEVALLVKVVGVAA